ncbi:MAG: nicotinate phosphoribosyltransferase, partial [Firmicutes bacterium]|nr:nicotinate phosphoribosyltransferase [Bacillota bacterium]
EIYPDNCTLLVDTYNVLNSGVPNAIRVFREMKPTSMGIRIDSGDVAYLTKKARQMLDEAGFKDCKIVISNSLDEYLIEDLLAQGACIDSFGVGERLITAKSEPVFGGVYKMSAVEKDGMVIPKMKISENVEKITNPGAKKVYRLYDRATDRAIADVIALMEEEIPEEEGYTIFDPANVWKKKNLSDFYAKELLVQIFKEGECIYDVPNINDVRDYCKDQVEHLWEEVRRFENPQTYYVDLSSKLWRMKQDILEQHNG